MRRIPKKTKYIYMTCPIELVEYFEDLAREELKDEGTEPNKMLLSGRRNNLMLDILQSWKNDDQEK